MRTNFRGMGRVCVPLVFLWLALFVAGDAKADTPMVLGLDQLIQMALEYSPHLKEADQDVVIAESDLGQAKAARWAQMDVVGTAGPVEDAKRPIVRVPFASITPQGFVGELKDRDEDEIGIFGRLDIAVVQPLITFGKISHRKAAAAFGLEAQKAAKEKARGDLILNVKQLYFGYIVAQQGKGAAEDADGFVQDAKKRVQSLLRRKATTVDETDLYRLQALEAQIKQFKAKADSGARVAYLALKKTVGLPENQEFQLDLKELPQDSRALMGGEEAFVRKAMEQRADLEQLYKGIEARKSLYEAARADLYPSIFVAGIASFAGAPGRDRLDISYFSDEFNHAYGGVVLGGQWHFDFGIGVNKVKKARAEYDKLVHTKEYAEQNIPVEVGKYYQDAVESRESFEAYDKGTVAARKWVVAAFANFDMGVGNAKDLFDSIDRYGKNQGEYLISLYNYNVALANLSNAAGEYRAVAQ